MEEAQAGIGESLHGIELAILHGHRERIAIRDALDDDLVHLWLYVTPVVLVLLEYDLGIADGYRQIRSCADDDVIVFPCFHIDDAPVGIGKVIEESGYLLLGFDCDGVIICCDGVDLEVFWSTVILFQQVIETCLDGLSRYLLSV